MTPTEAHTLALGQGVLPAWAIYDKPVDYPEGFIARMYIATRGACSPTTTSIKAATLNDVRKQLPPGLVNLGRSPLDDPCVVETWI